MPSILLVEDEFILSEDLKEILINFGYEVVGMSACGEDAIAIAESLRPDLVMMDIMLVGEIDGIDAAIEIRQRLQIPVIFLSAYANETIIQRAKKAQPCGYVFKPFQEHEIKAAVELALHKHATQQQIAENEKWLDNVLTSIGDGVITTDIHEAVTFLNPVAESLTGWMLDEAIGLPYDKVFNIVYAKTKCAVESPIRRAIQSGDAIRFSADVLLIKRDGEAISIDDSAAPIRDKQGDIRGGVVIFRGSPN